VRTSVYVYVYMSARVCPWYARVYVRVYIRVKVVLFVCSVSPQVISLSSPLLPLYRYLHAAEIARLPI
jgi:hypothetical protein